MSARLTRKHLESARRTAYIRQRPKVSRPSNLPAWLSKEQFDTYPEADIGYVNPPRFHPNIPQGRRRNRTGQYWRYDKPLSRRPKRWPPATWPVEKPTRDPYRRKPFPFPWPRDVPPPPIPRDDPWEREDDQPVPTPPPPEEPPEQTYERPKDVWPQCSDDPIEQTLFKIPPCSKHRGQIQIKGSIF